MDAKKSIEDRVVWIKSVLAKSGAKGVVYGNSGGKDCTLVGALCRLATDNVLGIIMPCQSPCNYGSDRDDAIEAGKFFGIEQIQIDLTAVKATLTKALEPALSSASAEGAVKSALMNINPRLRMTALYAVAQANGYLVAGTGNACETTVGYFTKWGDGACDFNPIADLDVAEVYQLLRELKAPSAIISKAPSAGLYPGQTDEDELGMSYEDIGKWLKGDSLPAEAAAKISRAHAATEHKRRMPMRYGSDNP